MIDQPQLDLETIHVVGNCWGPEWHVCDSHHRTFKHGLQPGFFYNVIDAVAFALSHDRTPIVHEHWCFATSLNKCDCRHSSLATKAPLTGQSKG